MMSFMAATILIVEDDFGFRETLQATLVERGHDVEVARNGAEALGMLYRIAGPALILLDLQMPVMDGIEFLHHFRRRSDRPGDQVVIMSAVVTGDFVRPPPGVARALKKPFDLADMLQIVEEFDRADSKLHDPPSV
jgi:CheY-like chemotaxis protein